MIPTKAFVTFETEEAYILMLQQGGFEIFGVNTDFNEAVEPTNIKWEN